MKKFPVHADGQGYAWTGLNTSINTFKKYISYLTFGVTKKMVVRSLLLNLIIDFPFLTKLLKEGGRRRRQFKLALPIDRLGQAGKQSNLLGCHFCPLASRFGQKFLNFNESRKETILQEQNVAAVHQGNQRRQRVTADERP